MKTFKVWNKKDKINGIDADDIIKSHFIKDTDEIFLVMLGNRVSEIQFKDTIVSNHMLDSNLSCEEVAQKYMELKQQEENEQRNEVKSLGQQQKEMDELKKQNADLENALVELAGMVGGA